MKYLRLHTTDPYYNLAVEEYLFDHESGDVMMLWQNEPSVVVGINQNIRAEVDLAALAERGVHPVRRITGGGAVYHDLGNINYTFISSRAEGGIDFESFSRPIVGALGSLGVTVTLSGRNDLCLPDGRKVSGNAQCARGDRTLHHGTLLFCADLSVLGELLTPDEEKLKTKAVRSARARVANLKELLPNITSAAELISHIEKYIIDKTSPELIAAPEGEKIDELYRRNSSEGWLYPERGVSSSCTVTRRRRYPFGSVCAEISFKGATIESLRISGDFFGSEDVRALEAIIAGHTLGELRDILGAAPVASYISGMSAEELCALLTE